MNSDDNTGPKSGYLYTWSSWNWVDFQDAVHRVNTEDLYEIRWSCGRRKNIELGDIVFLVRLGKIPIKSKGIVGCGYVVSKPYQANHFSDKEKTSLFTDVIFKTLSSQPLIDLATLKTMHPEVHWTPEQGGAKLPEEVVKNLISRLDSITDFEGWPKKGEITKYIEGKPRTRTRIAYDRSPRARQACIEAHGYACAVCSFKFIDMYGELGSTYIQVHHLKQLAEIGEEYVVDPVNDLRPVCANCHCMLHLKKPSYSIEELKARLS
jgi:5-methylcytosine-specific restriction enzyme A